ncbi:MAG: bifunctional phosphopantothenoylcysteine decarboxylase/phosphopantothenate--cysteine ligase CoaBC [Candidatus Heimdallarchaeota archaeon]
MAKYKPNHHSSKLEITGKTSELLKEKKIVIGLTGSVAVVETVHLARLLMRHGAEVIIAMTKAAQDLIQPDLLEWATGNPVITELTGQIEHVHLCGLHPERADLLLIAPSTANTIGKVATGIDDTVVTTFATTALGSKMPIAIVPAMHSSMYQNPVVVENIEKLKKIGIRFIGPRIEEGKAKIATNDDILEEVVSLLTKNDLKGKKVVITAGPTRAWIDDIRFITNPSSGKMGLEIAKEAKSRGADVTLIIGPTTITIPNIGLNIVRIDTTQDIVNTINDLSKIDFFISAAAIGDYEPIKTKGKIPSKQAKLTIELKPTPKVIGVVKKKFPKATIIGFKAEVDLTKEQLIEKAKASLQQHDIDVVVGNIVNKPKQGFATATNEVIIVKKKGKPNHIPLVSKRSIANIILNEL